MSLLSLLAESKRSIKGFVMATILVTWELGLAMGHVGVVRPVIDKLIRQGHRVVAAIKDVAHAPDLSKTAAIQCLRAPVRLSSVRAPFHSA